MKRPSINFDYDICLSFASEDRQFARRLATKLKKEKFEVFFDDFEKRSLWGKDLFPYLFEIYSRKCRHCIILFSRAYLRKNWTNHELRAAQLRTLRERREYVLPVKIGRCIIPEEFASLAYLDMGRDSIKDVVIGAIIKRGDAAEGEGWIPKKKLVAAIRHEETYDVFTGTFREALLAERDPQKALAKAFCAVLYLVQDDYDGALSAFLSFLTTDFFPLWPYFDRKNRFKIHSKGGVMLRGIDVAGRGKLYMQAPFWKKMRSEWDRAYGHTSSKRKASTAYRAKMDLLIQRAFDRVHAQRAKQLGS